ncbi:MAG TPA: Dabb family protein [Ktedonobacterales bacterium]
MIRHEVILRIKPDYPRERIDRALFEIRGLLRQIDGITRVRTGANNAATYRHALIVVDIADEIALQRFQRHPLHARAVRLVGRMAESTAVGSYLVGTEHPR